MSRVRVVFSTIGAVLLLAGAACGSSSSSGGNSSASTPPTTSTPSTSTPTSSSVGGGSGFCGQGKKDITDLQTKLAGLSGLAGTAAGLKAEMDTLSTAYQNAESDAPDSIKPDIQTIQEFVAKVNDIFKSHNYNLQESAPQLQAEFTGATAAKLKLAGQHLQAWAVANCGA